MHSETLREYMGGGEKNPHSPGEGTYRGDMHTRLSIELSDALSMK